MGLKLFFPFRYNEKMNTKNQVVVITGGASGIGQAIAAALSKLKYQVVILDVDKKEGLKTARAAKCDFEPCDVTKIDDLKSAFLSLSQKYGRLDCLINNAGVYIKGQLLTNNPEEIKKVIDVNLTAPIIATRLVLPLMKKQASGFIINIISQAGFYTKRECSVYNSSKWALTAFTRIIEPELAPYNIRVTGIYPGLVKTNLFKNARVKSDTKNGLDPKVIGRLVAFLLASAENEVYPEIGVKNIANY